MVGGGGSRHSTTCQGPGFPRLTEEIKPALLVDKSQIGFIGIVEVWIHIHGIIHHVGSHPLTQGPDIRIGNEAAILRIEIGPTAGILRYVRPENTGLVNALEEHLVDVHIRDTDATYATSTNFGFHKEHICVSDKDLRHIFLVAGQVVVER